MSWLDDLSLELHARGVPRRERTRIVLELDDHIASEPGCEDRLGDPRALAISSPMSSPTAEARGSAFATFAALAAAAVVLVVSQITLGRFAALPGLFERDLDAAVLPGDPRDGGGAAGRARGGNPGGLAGGAPAASWQACPPRRSRSSSAARGLRSPRASRRSPASSCTSWTSPSACPGGGSGSFGGLAASPARACSPRRGSSCGPGDRLGRRRWRRRHLRRSPGARMALAASAAVAPRRARVARGRDRAGRVRGARRALGVRGHPARSVRGHRRRDRVRPPRPRDRSPAARLTAPPARGRIPSWVSPIPTTSPPTTSSRSAGSADRGR